MKRALIYLFIGCALLYVCPNLALTGSDRNEEPLLGNRSVQTPSEMAYQRDPELDIEIEAIMEELHVVGAAVATFCTDNVYHLGHYGFAQLADSIPVSETTFFLNGSVSKVVTATVGLQAWEDLDISLDVEVADYLDFDIEHPTCPDSALTLRHTYTHTAGFPDVYPATQDTPICEDLAEALDPAGQHYDPGMWFPYCPGLGFQYNGTGPCLAACFAAQNGGPTFSEYCQANLFDPLGMIDATWFGYECDPDRVSYTYTYHADGDTFSVLYDEYHGSAGYPANGLATTSVDLTRHTMAIMQRGRLGDVRILEESTVDEMLTVQFPGADPDQGLMWYRTYWSTLQDRVWGHGGGSNGFVTYVAIAETEGRDFGWIVTVNSGGVDAIVAISIALFQNILANLDACESPAVPVAEVEVPTGLQLDPVHPNPFNPQTTITFALNRPQHAEVAVYDLMGKQIAVLADHAFDAGTHHVVWNGRDAAGHAVTSGTYLVRLATDSGVEARKVMLLR